MSVHEQIEFRKSTKEAIQKYERIFGEGTFPTYYFMYVVETEDFEKDIMAAIDKCLRNNKDIYELGIVPLEALHICC